MTKPEQGKEGASANTGARKRAEASRRKGAQRKAKGKKAPARTPFYDRDHRELVVGKVVVKRFTQRSDAQETILTAFQEEGWPRSIDDPLSGKEGQDRKQRLRTALDNLNRRQRPALLHFHVIRQGTGVAWEYWKARGSRATGKRR